MKGKKDKIEPQSFLSFFNFYYLQLLELEICFITHSFRQRSLVFLFRVLTSLLSLDFVACLVVKSYNSFGSTFGIKIKLRGSESSRVQNFSYEMTILPFIYFKNYNSYFKFIRLFSSSSLFKNPTRFNGLFFFIV